MISRRFASFRSYLQSQKLSFFNRKRKEKGGGGFLLWEEATRNVAHAARDVDEGAFLSTGFE